MRNKTLPSKYSSLKNVYVIQHAWKSPAQLLKQVLSRITLLVLAAAASVPSVTAICGGFNFAIGNVIPNGGGAGVNRWNVYDDSCNIHDGISTVDNPCTQGIFGCSPPPVIFNEYTDRSTGLRYACRPDPSSGKCGEDTISVCCRNDGN
ncbi:hypothetical protein BDZ94DRAFT_1296327 [Collybia nuda]|uniref:Uncharacterized protein n=1 Tax=Collybia nuda TaxID=64659 RepID=A0A9P5YB91_9AGAR|nr:hypothetical protein BDZ94DRAFT_1296327 [Collybia nuda]